MAQHPTYAELLETVQKQAEEIQKQAETIKLLKRRLRERRPPPSTPTPAADNGGRIKELEDQLEEKTLSIRNASKNALHTPAESILQAQLHARVPRLPARASGVQLLRGDGSG